MEETEITTCVTMKTSVPVVLKSLDAEVDKPDVGEAGGEQGSILLRQSGAHTMEDPQMTDFGTVVEMLEALQQRADPDLQQQVEKIIEALGRLQVEFSMQEGAYLVPPSCEPPTEPQIEIIGGVETDQFPDCCAVGDDEEYYCSGTLIAPTVVVTADHCHGVTRVFLSGSDVAVPEQGETIPVLQAFSHPVVDIQVLVLERVSKVAPRLISDSALIDGMTNATVVGFGHIDPQGMYGYGRKRRVEVPIMCLGCDDPDDPKRFGCLPGRELVAGHSGLMLDSCRGDSGGPLYIQGKDDRLYLLGVTSRGAREGFHVCGDGGIYVRVDLCLDWIQQVTGVQIVEPTPKTA